MRRNLASNDFLPREKSSALGLEGEERKKKERKKERKKEKEIRADVSHQLITSFI